MTAKWEWIPATSVSVGDTIRARGLDLTVTRIETPFLGRESYIAFIEDSDRQWLKIPVASETTIERLVSCVADDALGVRHG